MPVIKSAIKKLRQDRKKTIVNNQIKSEYKDAIKLAKKSAKKDLLQKAFSSIDTAVKKKIIHKNKAARLKSQLALAHGKSKSTAKRGS
jgi:small subunit ribosomal protein S20